MQLQALGLRQQPKELRSLLQPLQRPVINSPRNFPFTDIRNSPPVASLRNNCHKISSIFLAFALVLQLLAHHVFQLLFDPLLNRKVVTTTVFPAFKCNYFCRDQCNRY